MNRPQNPNSASGSTPFESAGQADDLAAYQTTDLMKRMKSGANDFYWIAALSAFNSLMIRFGGDLYFLIGLGGAMFVDGVFLGLEQAFPDIRTILTSIGLAISLGIAAIFALFGFFAGKGKRWAFVTGLICYAIDTLVMLAFQDWMGLLFHVFILFALSGGLVALNQLEKLSAE